MQLAVTADGWYLWRQYLPYFHNQCLATRQFVLHEIDVEVEVLVVELVGHLEANQGAEFFEVYDKTCFGVGLSAHGNDQVKVVAMPVLVGAGAKDFEILFFRPRRVVQLVRCVEMLFPAYVYHKANIH